MESVWLALLIGMIATGLVVSLGVLADWIAQLWERKGDESWRG